MVQGTALSQAPLGIHMDPNLAPVVPVVFLAAQQQPLESMLQHLELLLQHLDPLLHEALLDLAAPVWVGTVALDLLVAPEWVVIIAPDLLVAPGHVPTPPALLHPPPQPSHLQPHQ